MNTRTCMQAHTRACTQANTHINMASEEKGYELGRGRELLRVEMGQRRIMSRIYDQNTIHMIVKCHVLLYVINTG